MQPFFLLQLFGLKSNQQQQNAIENNWRWFITDAPSDKFSPILTATWHLHHEHAYRLRIKHSLPTPNRWLQFWRKLIWRPVPSTLRFASDRQWRPVANRHRCTDASATHHFKLTGCFATVRNKSVESGSIKTKSCKMKMRNRDPSHSTKDMQNAAARWQT